MHLPENSISSWEDVCHEFIDAFTGGHQEPGRRSDLQLLQQKEGETLCKYLQRFSKVDRNIPNIHPAAVIAAFQANVRNRRIRSKMNMRLSKTVKELYTLVDKRAWMEEGRKLPGEEDCINMDSDDDDESTSQKKSKKRSKKRRDKAVMTVEGSGTRSTGKIAKAEIPGKEVAVCADCQEVAAAEKAEKAMGHTARSIEPRATTFESTIRLSSSSRDKELSVRSVTRTKARMPLMARAEAVKQIALASPLGAKENPPGVR